MKQPITDYIQDDEQHWVALLACGHRQHVRHNPPMESREWVTTSEGRQEKLGALLDCLYCNMSPIPETAKIYKTSTTWDELSVPKGFTTEHSTKAGVWGQIVVESGRLLLEMLEPGSEASWVLTPHAKGNIPPQALHRVTPQGPVVFRIEFLREEPA